MRKASIVLALVGAVWLATAAVATAGAEDSTPSTTARNQALTDAGQALTDGARSRAKPVPDHTTLVSVEWKGDPAASFSVETQATDGTWVSSGDVGESDNGPDAGTQDAERVASRPALVSEPLHVENPSKVRLHVTGGTATDVHLTAIASAPDDTASTPSMPVAPGIAAIGLAGFVGLKGSRRTGAVLVVVILAGATFVGVDAPEADAAPNVPFPAQPRIVTRGEWGADESLRLGVCPSGPEYASPQLAIIHHTVNSNSYSAAESPALMRSLYQYFIGTRGYCDIAYNFIVDRFGTIFEGRAGGIARGVIGAHATNFNTGTIGVAMLGDYQGIAPSSGTVNAIIDLLAWKFSVHNINPYQPVSTRGAVVDPIIGHRDAGAISGDGTDCPGAGGYSALNTIRNAVRPRVAYNQPFGTIDSASATTAGIQVVGWAVSRETPAAANVHVYVDGAFAAQITADGNRPGLGTWLAGNGLAGWGDNHTFTTTVPASFGAHQVCVFVLGGANPSIGCKSVNYQPFGYLEKVSATPTGIQASGWAVNPQTTGSDTVHLYLDGAFVGATAASGNRPGLGGWLDQNGYAGYGDNRTFTAAINTPAARQFGNHLVCAFALGGANPSIGCRVIAVQPFGYLDSVKATPGGIQVVGWAVNPQTAGSGTVHLYLDGAFAGSTTANGNRSGLGSWLDQNGYIGYGDNHTFGATLAASYGMHTVCGYALGGVNPSISCQAVQVQPTGYLESLKATPGGILASGWAMNPATSGAATVHLYVDGAFAGSTGANGNRIGLGGWLDQNGYAGYGDNHTFGATLAASYGVHTVCGYALGGSNPSIGCRAINVQPLGYLESVSTTSTGIQAVGWAVNPQTAGAATVHFYVDGVFRASVPAGGNRPGLGVWFDQNGFAGYGDNHTLTTLLAAVSAGPHTVCAFVLGGINPNIGCKTA